MSKQADPLHEAMAAVDKSYELTDASAPQLHTTFAPKLTAERGTTHGPAALQFKTAQDFKNVIRSAAGSSTSPVQLEALEMIAVKMSRILHGNSGEPDHWDDIMGYAHLGKTGGTNG